MKYCLLFMSLVIFSGCSQSPPDKKVYEVDETSKEQEVMFKGNCPNGLCHKKVVKGLPEHKLEKNGKVFYFSSKKSMDEFNANFDVNFLQAQKNWESLGNQK